MFQYDDVDLRVLEGGKVKDMINLDYHATEMPHVEIEELIDQDKQLLIQKLVSDNQISLKHISDLQKIIRGQTQQIELLKVKQNEMG